jgi:hypothetical protein
VEKEMKACSAVGCWLALLVSLVLVPRAWAAEAETGGFVTQSQGAVTYQRAGEGAQPLPAFLVLAAGTQVQLGADGKLQITYLRTGRQETWTGQANLEVGEGESKATTGASPAVKVLPPFMVATLTRAPLVMAKVESRQGMIRVRALGTAAKVKQAEARYGELRAQAVEDDITPELFLLTTLHELSAYQPMRQPLAELLRRQPNSAEVKALHQRYSQLLDSDAAKPAAK